MDREHLEATLWRIWPQAHPAQIDTALQAATLYALDTYGITADRRAVLGAPPARTWHWPEDRVQPCGTPAAYQRHHRHREPVDEACRQAEKERRQKYRAGRASSSEEAAA